MNFVTLECGTPPISKVSVLQVKCEADSCCAELLGARHMIVAARKMRRCRQVTNHQIFLGMGRSGREFGNCQLWFGLTIDSCVRGVVRD